MGFGITPAVTQGYRTLADHFLEAHREWVIEHLLYHERTLPGCTTCAERHDIFVKAGGEQ